MSVIHGPLFKGMEHRAKEVEGQKTDDRRQRLFSLAMRYALCARGQTIRNLLLSYLSHFQTQIAILSLGIFWIYLEHSLICV